ncbi:MAG: dTDP-4-dehydrorhamnose reductase [Gammaproteobacteria bacterium]|nr:dTDP-4-dehydrorhamnose reductase [Gammaproteobacteria bacterium]
MKKILITGGNGQVAYELIQLFKAKNIVYIAPSHKELDIINLELINNVLNHFKPTAVINAAAFTQVDLAEQEVSLANAANQEGAKNIAIVCSKANIPLIHISTDYIFDGKQTVPYTESSQPNPLNIYGMTKWRGEIAVQEHYKEAMILRVSSVFGKHGNNFVKTILRLAKEREVLRIVSDQIMCPTPAKAIAETILVMLSHPRSGLYHYCGAEATHWHAFAQLIVEQARTFQPLRVKHIEAITTHEYPTPAKRPQYSVLDCQRIADVFGIQQPDWKQGLNHVITQLSAK